MFAADTLLPFFIISVLLALSPGPDNIYVASLSATRGARAGLIVSFGLCSGLILHTLLVAFGISGFIVRSPTAFTLLKITGVAYLLYLAWISLWEVDLTGKTVSIEYRQGYQLYLRGILMNITNPKVVLFFFALLPQFVEGEIGPAWKQVFLLGAVFMIAALVVFSAIALLSARMGSVWLQSTSVKKLFSRLAAVVFLGLAVRLLLDSLET